MARASLSAGSGRDEQRPDALRLAALLEAIAAAGQAGEPLEDLVRRHPRARGGFFSKQELLAAYRSAPARFPIEEDALLARLQTCPTRSLSGVVPVAVLTRPFPCPGRCVFCPNDVRMPKSYLADEPGCQRALEHDFDPHAQVTRRLAAYHAMGHPLGKLELIVLGGTFSAYPAGYQRWFVTRCLEAMNGFDASRAPGPERRLRGPVPRPEPPHAGQAYNEAVRRSAPGADGRADWEALERAAAANEVARARCVGLSVETRPDHVDAAEVLRLRRLGVTRVQLGIQSLSDAVLRANRRGHDVAASRAAAARLRRAGFKLLFHWMPNLLGATPESDLADFQRLFDDASLRPDELKIYPCSLVAGAELEAHHARGAWQPYATETLVALLAACLERVPGWCRVSRMIRDIPSNDILAGNLRTNLREDVEAALGGRGVALEEIRAREVRGRRVAIERLRETERRYETAVGEERFLEATLPGGGLAGFLRLLLPAGAPEIDELRGCALIREVHVYGAALALGERRAGRVQHAGLGAALVRRAAEAARRAGHAELAVISAFGTRPWYRRLGFRDGGLYQRLALA